MNRHARDRAQKRIGNQHECRDCDNAGFLRTHPKQFYSPIVKVPLHRTVIAGSTRIPDVERTPRSGILASRSTDPPPAHPFIELEDFGGWKMSARVLGSSKETDRSKPQRQQILVVDRNGNIQHCRVWRIRHGFSCRRFFATNARGSRNTMTPLHSDGVSLFNLGRNGYSRPAP
jgi:hypothetical protein